MPRENYHFWHPEEEAELRRLYEGEGLAGPECARRLNRSWVSVKNKIAKMGLSLKTATFQRFEGAKLTRVVREDAGVAVIAPEETAGESADDFLQRIVKQTSAATTKAKTERYVTLRIASDRPIGLSLSSDWHLSATSATDVQAFLEYADTIRQSAGCYALAVGDLTDNPIKHQPQNVTSIPDELRLLDIAVGRFGGKLLAVTSGNHDDWTRTMVGVDSLRTMGEKHRIHYAPDELVYLVEIVHPDDALTVTARWVIATRHKYYRHSNLNHTHACWRWLEDNANNWPTDARGATLLPDVLAIGHNHVAAVEHRTYERGTVIACRMGSFQHTSPFTRAGGWTLMPPTCPTVILPNVRDGSPANQPHAYEQYEQATKALASGLHADAA